MPELCIATVNVNGLRAAARKGLHQWLDERRPDVVALQELRCPDELVGDLLGDGWHVVHAECATKGRAGVAVASRQPFARRAIGEGEPAFAGTGRWAEADLDGLPVTVVSTYVPTGDETSPERMAEKFAFLAAMTERMSELRADGRELVVTGDLNVAHRDSDLKNWKGNIGKAGCLPEERAWFDRWAAEGWVDVARAAAGDGPVPFTWWSFRGRAFDNDAGWRIDYQIATPGLAAGVAGCAVDRAPTYADRWSDHAPVVATYRI